MNQEAEVKVNSNMAQTARIKAEYGLPTTIAIMAVALGNIMASAETATAVSKAILADSSKLTLREREQLRLAAGEAMGGFGATAKNNLEALTKSIFKDMLSSGMVHEPVSMALAIRDVANVRLSGLVETIEGAKEGKTP